MDLYQGIWKNFTKRQQKQLIKEGLNTMNLERVAETIWRPTEKRLHSLINAIKIGSLTFQEIDDSLSHFKGKH